MRVLYVCADRGIPVYGEKGASIHVQEMARSLVALGHEVKIVCSLAGESEAGSSVFDVRQIVSSSKIPEVNRESKERNAMAVAESMESAIRQLYQSWPFDLIYERYSLWSAAGCRAGRALGVRTIVEVNAPLINEQETYRQLVLKAEARAIETEVYRSADALVSVSTHLSEYLIRQGAQPNRVYTIGNAVDTERFSPDVRAASIAGIESQDFVVGFSGSLKLWHGIDSLMTAFQEFLERVPQGKLLVVGDGPNRGWAEGFAAGAGISEAVVFPGWVSHQDLPSYIARMDVAVAPYPASEEHYFSPLKLYEYLASGRPIVASRIGQTAELLEDGQQALLTEPGSVDALVDSLLQLYDNPLLATRLATAAASEGKKHDWLGNARKIIELGSAGVRAYG